ncbi:hypothetical protein LTR85_006798 [Meristemomyces frigidus]|nr:hypothetical protein LTR85_006798 [Meristemomyces frigidus]
MASKQEWMIILPDKPGMLAKRMEVRPDHLSALKPLVDSNFFVFGGASLEEPLKEGEGPKANGSVMLALADTKEEVLEKVKEDIYAKSGVWDESKEAIMGAITSPSKTKAKSSTTAVKRKRNSVKPWYETVKKRRTAPGTTAARTAAANKALATRRSRANPVIKSASPTAGFANLPGELRNKIYELTLLGDNAEPIRITSAQDLMGRNLALGLLGSCKAVRKEALSYFYNNFRIDIVKLNQNTRREGPLEYFTECYDSRAKAYEAPVRRFIDCARYTSRLNKDSGLKAISSISFAYHHDDSSAVHRAQRIIFGSSSYLPVIADLVLTWTLQPYSLAVDYALSAETDRSKIDEVKSRMSSTIDNMIELRSVEKFASNDVVEVADRMYYSCMNMKVGE